jgi:hypothetical protein
MAAASANESVCASTGASPAATPVGRLAQVNQHLTPNPPATLALKEATTVVGDGGAASVVFLFDQI